MFKKLLILYFLLFVTLFAADKDKKKDEFRTVQNNAFKIGEKLTFDIKYGFVTAGVAVMEIPNIKRISGRKAYQVKFQVNSVPSFDWIFKVRDRYETYIDTQGRRL
jgi:hypothetical protein